MQSKILRAALSSIKFTITIILVERGYSMATYKPHICLDIDVNGRTYTISEGATVYGLTYTENGVEKCVDGAIRVINTSQTKVMVKQTCPPESYFGQTVACQSIIVDTSKKYKASLKQVPITAITAIGSVENSIHEESSAPIPIVDDVSDISPDDLYANMTVLDRIE